MTELALNVVAGILVAAVLWAARAAYSRLRSVLAIRIQHALEQLTMSRRRMPDLSPGPRRDLTRYIHDLDARVPGQISARAIATEHRLSPTTVTKVFNGQRTSQDLAVRVALHLAYRAQGGMSCAELDDIDRTVRSMWEAAEQADHPGRPDPVEQALTDLWAELGDRDSHHPLSLPPTVQEAIARTELVYTQESETDGAAFLLCQDVRAFELLQTMPWLDQRTWRDDLAHEVSLRAGRIAHIHFEAILNDG
ncbi:hypothetical protein SAMN06272775_0002 [Streptomyces sp. 2323.1]|uniref:hypothetical protein n=1 Tax=Streptomyces sp. 2323.1 TaxID=1938841 RepID=UPI000BBFE428|nr:hypothetical protein [Streptomyces sp. 2323.1]SOE08921.1 hypothetical protein SAMN06272775_0002 [Streptomyces sp. 2323.1]